MKKLKRLLPVLLGFSGIIFSFFGGPSASAKEMARRLGVGYSNESSINLPSIAAIYYPSSRDAFTGALGFQSGADTSSFALQGGLRRFIFTEDNMNFYMGGLLSVLSQSTGLATDSGLELSAVVGGEFFLPGLENLGFSFDTGLAFSNFPLAARIRTVGNSFLNAGIIFYF